MIERRAPLARLARRAVAAACAAAILGFPTAARPPASQPAKPKPKPAIARTSTTPVDLPLRFEPNLGQWPSDVRFVAQGRGGTVALRDRDAVVSIAVPASAKTTAPLGCRACKPSDPGSPKNAPKDPTPSHVSIRPVGSAAPARVDAVDRLAGITNYFLSSDPSAWRTNVPGYARVRYDGVYPGVDLVYHSSAQGRVEYDFVVAPGADPSPIAMAVDGALSVSIDASGDLVMKTATGAISQHAPLVYQDDETGRHAIAARFVKVADDRVAFDLAAYDSSKALVIDPEVVYSTYLGSSQADYATGFAVDSAGCAYVTGQAGAEDYPLVHPFQSARGGVFVTKLAADGGSLVYSTYLGASAFSHGVTVDAAGAAYVFGDAGTGFPLKNAIQTTVRGDRDAFVAKLAPDGASLEYSTYLGGSGDPGQFAGDYATDLKVDSTGIAYVVGLTQASHNDFPTVQPVQATFGGGTSDWFVSVISADGKTLLSSTYFGGNDDEVDPRVALDENGSRAVLSGSSYSTDLPGTTKVGLPPPDLCEDWLVEFNFNFLHQLIIEDVIDVIKTIDPSPDCLILLGAWFIATLAYFYILQSYTAPSSLSKVAGSPGGGVDAVVTAFDPHLGRGVTKFFGGSGSEYARGIVADSQGAAYVVGSTNSTDLPVKDAVQPALGGNDDAFVAVFAPGSLDVAFATYLGGPGFERSGGVALDPQGNIYVLVNTESAQLPTTPGAFQEHPPGLGDAYIVKLSALGPLAPDFSIAANPSTLTVSRGQKGTLTVDIARLGGFDGNVKVTAPDTKSIKVKLTPPTASSGGDSVTFNYKIKKKAALGSYDLVFHGKDDEGRDREATLRLIVQ